MSPVVLLGAGAAAAYFLFFKKGSGIINESSAPKAQTSFAKDPVTGALFGAQAVGNGTADVFTQAGARVVRFDIQTKREIISPPGVDPTIKAAAIRAFGILPKA